MENQNIHEQIKQARKAKGLTQQELADETGLSLRTIQRVEKGTQEISGFSLKQICKVLGISIEQIIIQNVNHVSIDSNQIGAIKVLYFSSLTFLINPILGLVLTAVIGHWKQAKSDLYKHHLKKVLLIQGIPLLFFSVIMIYALLSSIFHLPLPKYRRLEGIIMYGMPVLYISIVLVLILSNLFMVKPNKGLEKSNTNPQ